MATIDQMNLQPPRVDDASSLSEGFVTASRGSSDTSGQKWQVYPAYPGTLVTRSSRPYYVPFEVPREHIIRKCRLDYSEEAPLPLGWAKYINPEGQPFFHHSEMNVVTETWIYDAQIAEEMIPVILYLVETRDHTPSLVGHQHLIVIDRDEHGYPVDEANNDDGVRYGYYLTHIKNRVIFWLEDHYVDDLHYTFPFGGFDNTMTGHALEREYWRHFEIFANIQVPSDALWDEVIAILLFLQADVTTSSTSTSGFSKESIEIMISNMYNARQTPATMYMKTGVAWTIGRFMHMNMSDRMWAYYGTRGAKLDGRMRLFDPKHYDYVSPSTAFSVLSLIMFGGPRTTTSQLQPLLVDPFVWHVEFEGFATSLEGDWERYTGLGTIILAANAAFLAIPGVSDHGSTNAWAKNLSYCSMIASFSCIVLALLYIRRLHVDTFFVRDLGFNIAYKGDMRRRSLGSLPIRLCLPYAMLMWSMVLFLAAFLAMCFSQEERVTTVVVTCAAGVWMFCILWGLELVSTDSLRKVLNGLLLGLNGTKDHLARLRERRQWNLHV